MSFATGTQTTNGGAVAWGDATADNYAYVYTPTSATKQVTFTLGAYTPSASGTVSVTGTATTATLNKNGWDSVSVLTLASNVYNTTSGVGGNTIAIPLQMKSDASGSIGVELNMGMKVYAYAGTDDLAHTINWDLPSAGSNSEFALLNQGAALTLTNIAKFQGTAAGNNKNITAAQTQGNAIAQSPVAYTTIDIENYAGPSLSDTALSGVGGTISFYDFKNVGVPYYGQSQNAFNGKLNLQVSVADGYQLAGGVVTITNNTNKVSQDYAIAPNYYGVTTIDLDQAPYNTGAPALYTTGTPADYTITATFVGTGTTPPDTNGYYFNDVPLPNTPKATWYSDCVYEAANQGYMTGYESNWFGPNDSILRQDVAGVLFKMSGWESAKAYWEHEVENGPIENQTKFPDVNTTDYYYYAALWAGACEVVNGVQIDGVGYFEGTDNATREEMMAMFANYVQAAVSTDNFVDGIINNYDPSYDLKYFTTDPNAEAHVAQTLATFPDGAEVSDWARPVVAWAAANHYVNGVDVNGTRYLMPQANITRAEVAAIAINLQPLSIANYNALHGTNSANVGDIHITGWGQWTATDNGQD